MPRTMMFQGKTYHYDSDYSDKSEAQNVACKFRRSNHKARVMKSVDLNFDGTPQWSVYVRRTQD